MHSPGWIIHPCSVSEMKTQSGVAREKGASHFVRNSVGTMTTSLLLKHVLVILHIATAAAWFGLGLRLAGRARAVVGETGEARVALVEDGAQSVWLMNVFIILTLLFSLGAFIAGGHFASYGPAYHAAVTLIVILTLDQLFVIRSGWSTLQANVEPESGNPEAAESGRKRVAIGTGVGHLLWIVLLILMFWDRLAGAL